MFTITTIEDLRAWQARMVWNGQRAAAELRISLSRYYAMSSAKTAPSPSVARLAEVLEELAALKAATTLPEKSSPVILEPLVASQPVSEAETVAAFVPTLTHEEKWTVVYNKSFNGWCDTLSVPVSGMDILRPLVRREILGIKIPDTDEDDLLAADRNRDWKSATQKSSFEMENYTLQLTYYVRNDIDRHYVREQAAGRL